jgi:hypothetical protein
MKDNVEMMESLMEKTIDYSKTSFELLKLRSLDKATNVLSTIIPHAGVLVLVASFVLLFNFGLSFWLGEVLGRMAYGFFAVAGFYAIMGLTIRLFLQRWLKFRLRNYFIKHMLN